MSTSEELFDSLKKSGEAIQAIIRNYKKDSPERKTNPVYYEERLKRLTDAWDQFEAQDTKLRTLDDVSKLRMEHEYFTDDYYNKISTLSNTYLEIFSSEVNRLKKLQKPLKESVESILKNQQSSEQNEKSDNHQGLIRIIRARMTALRRIINGIAPNEEIQARQYYDFKINTINKLWSQIQDTYYEICIHLEDPTRCGFEIDEYNDLEDIVQQQLINLSIMAATYDTNTVPHPTIPSSMNLPSALPLPKITIPQFNGDCLKWCQFYELFKEMVDKQPLPNVQKMWYLKSNISGEAEKLISHLTLTEENYKTAWTLLQERYDNKRVIVATLVDKILNQPTGTMSSASIKALHDTTKECLLALNNLDVDTSSWDAIIIQLMIKKLDRALYIRFIQSLTKPRDVPTMKELFSFLEIQFQSMESIGYKEKSTAHQKDKMTVSSVASMYNNNCKLCTTEYHPIYHCKNFLNMTETDRLRWAQQQKLCVNCLKDDHVTKVCTSSGCRKCNKNHNSLLHLQQSIHKKQKTSIPHVQPTSKRGDSITVSSTSMKPSIGHKNYVMLATARVVIKATNGITHEFRAILDSGSQVNIVTERLIRKLSLSPMEASLCIDGVGRLKKRAAHRVNVEMFSTSNDFSTNLEAIVLPTIIPAQPNQNLDISTWNIPSNIDLADPRFYQQGKIDVLLGAEFYFSLMQPGAIKLNNGGPTLQNTLLGWIVGGAVRQTIAQSSSPPLTCAVFGEESSLEQAIERLWKLDEVESNERTLSPADAQCEAHFIHHTQTNTDGRFIVSLPFRENPTSLGDSHAMAYKRFVSLEQRLLKHENIRIQYTQFMREYEQLGHMQRVNLDNVPHPRYFIPHHCVLKPESTTTKLRVVFDASAKTSTGYSLNDLMYTGPVVQSELFSILIRFRLPRFVFTTDIEKMYRQILINPNDHQYQLIMWREGPSSPLAYYRLNTVTYGTRSAPYLATRCLQKIAIENSIKFPYGSQMLKDNFYVDDGLGGSDNLNIAVETQKELIIMLKKYGFSLKKWCANHPQLLKNIPTGDQEVNLDFDNDSTNSIKTLGLYWLPKSDNFCVKVNLTQHPQISKRTVTSDLAKLFDPLGLLAPVIVKAKIFIQQLWRHELDWDEPLTNDLCAAWSTFRNELESLNNFKIPRHIFQGATPVKTQLHVFADASEKAFGAVAYIRAILKNGQVIVRMLCAKSRVAPLKQQTLPRLELCAAVLAAQLAHRLKIDLQLPDQVTFLWTDSEIILAWIYSQSSSYKTFVANRVSTIQSITLAEQWRHVRSKHNPADILSRGLRAVDLPACNLWLHGPLFLHGREESWASKYSPQEITNDIEKKKVVPITATMIVNDGNLIYGIQHKNSFRRLQRILAYVLRFTRNLRMPKTQRPKNMALIPKELDDSLFQIIYAIQASDFAAEIKQLKGDKQINKHSSISSLSPFLDELGIVRVGGRLKHSNLQPDAKHPIILPYNDPLVKLLFTMTHEECKHCGPQALLNTIRQRFWPIKGKITARSVIQKCIRCTRARPQLYQQVMGNLPEQRVVPARPFINAGVDYCGPFWVHYKVRGKRPTKAYVAVFCCFATKAVHLELVSDLSTESFIGCLKRFIARRGHCQNIYCDNATNFVGAKNKLAELSENIYSDKAKEAIISASSSKGIHFHFIPPRAPHFGGLWEAAVKSAKHLLVRSVSTESLTYEELETIIIEIEAILNSRPLTPLSNDPDSLEALTPGHFLIGEALTSQVDSRAETVKTSTISHWKLISHIKQQFWKRWSAEYLHELQQRHKWQHRSSNLKKGDMVIMKEDNLPTMKWPLGRIVNVVTADDGAVRVVEVKTSTGVFKRPIHRLAPLFPESEKEVSTEMKPILERSLSRTDENDTIPAKRFKPPNNPIILTVLLSLVFMPVVLCNNLLVTQFQNEPGLYFEGIGTVKMNTAEWKMLVYYDLTPFVSETKSLSSGLETLQQMCPVMQQYSICNILLSNIKQIENELLQEEELFTNRRFKRSPFNIVGNIARSLFGVLDEDYAAEMSKTINKAKIEHDHITSLLKNQTSIIDSTINIIKQDEINTQQKINEILRMVELNKNNVAKESSQLSNTQLVGLLSTHLALIAINLQRIEAEIINVLTDTHNGRISPSLLSPHQLKKEITVIKANLPASHALPTTGDNLIELYKLMKVKGAVMKNEVIFEVRIPLVNQQFFELFKIVPVPTIKNNTLIAINPDASYLATDAHREEYMLFKSEDVAACVKPNDDEYICKNQQSKLRRNANANPCEINIFNNQSTTNCNLNRIPGMTTWSQLNHQNKWIFAAITDIEASMVCGMETTLITIRNSGILEIGPNCVIRNKFVTIQGHFEASNNIHTSYVRLKQIESISRPQEIENVVVNMKPNQYKVNIEELKNLQKQLNESTLEHLPQLINSNSQHHHAVSYTSLTLCIIILLGLLSWKIHSKFNKASQFTPEPALRSQPSIDVADTPINQPTPPPRFTINI